MEVRSCGVCKGRDGYKWRSGHVVSARGEMDINGGQVMWCLSARGEMDINGGQVMWCLSARGRWI